MTGRAAALPRTRRRRRRPPNDAERLALGALFGAGFGVLMWLVIGAIVQEPWIIPLVLLSILVNVVVAAKYWPTAWNYIVNGYRDD